LTITPFGSKGLDSSAEDSNDIDPASAVKQLNDALDGLVSANRAIATPGKGSIRATVSDFAEHAQTARAFKTAISK
jgi:hydrogenase maturation factor HypF (carbamoyltransferase family)